MGKEKKRIQGKLAQEPILSCHWGNIEVFAWEHIRFWGGGLLRGGHPIAGGVVIQLTDYIEQWPAPKVWGRGLSGLEDWKQRWADFTLVHIPIVDYGVPSWPREFWEELLEVLYTEGETRKQRGEPPLDVVVLCGGGHGRTGMVLAIFYGLCHPDSDPGAVVRARYCERAIETEEQIEYIREITGCSVEIGPAAMEEVVVRWSSPWGGFWQRK